MKAKVHIMFKEGVLDPQGKAVGHALAGLGFGGVNEVRQGKYIELELDETDPGKARRSVEADPVERGRPVPVRAQDELVDARRAGGAHAPREFREVAAAARVSARPEQIGAHRDRHEAERDAVREIDAVHAGRERDGVPVAELAAEAAHQLDGQHVQRLPRQIHVPLGRREEVAVVLDDQRVGELETESAAAGRGCLAEPPDKVGHLRPRRVALERPVGHADVVVAQPVVQDPARLGRPEQHRVQLDDDVDAHVAKQEPGDALDLRRRAAVERAQRDRVRHAGRERQIAEHRVLGGNLAAQPIDDGPRLAHAVHEGPHPIAPDTREIVADAHVEDDVGEAGGERQPPARHQHLDEHGRLDVLLDRLLELQLLRPLHVEADRLHVDARPRNGDLVVVLDGLQLDDPSAGQPGEDDVLRELRLGTRGGPEGRRGPPAVEAHGEIDVRMAEEGAVDRQIEDGAVPLQLAERPADERPERAGTKGGHSGRFYY